jgi:hypothetical protein
MKLGQYNFEQFSTGFASFNLNANESSDSDEQKKIANEKKKDRTFFNSVSVIPLS